MLRQHDAVREDWRMQPSCQWSDCGVRRVFAFVAGLFVSQTFEHDWVDLKVQEQIQDATIRFNFGTQATVLPV